METVITFLRPSTPDIVPATIMAMPMVPVVRDSARLAVAGDCWNCAENTGSSGCVQ